MLKREDGLDRPLFTQWEQVDQPLPKGW